MLWQFFNNFTYIWEKDLNCLCMDMVQYNDLLSFQVLTNWGRGGTYRKPKWRLYVHCTVYVHSTDLVILSCLTEHILQYITIHRLLNLAELCHMVNGSGVPPNWGPAPGLPITRLTVRPNLPDQVKGPSQGHQTALSLEGPFHRTLSRGDWKPRILK